MYWQTIIKYLPHDSIALSFLFHPSYKHFLYTLVHIKFVFTYFYRFSLYFVYLRTFQEVSVVHENTHIWRRQQRTKHASWENNIQSSLSTFSLLCCPFIFVFSRFPCVYSMFVKIIYIFILVFFCLCYEKKVV